MANNWRKIEIERRDRRKKNPSRGLIVRRFSSFDELPTTVVVTQKNIKPQPKTAKMYLDNLRVEDLSLDQIIDILGVDKFLDVVGELAHKPYTTTPIKVYVNEPLITDGVGFEP